MQDIVLSKELQSEALKLIKKFFLAEKEEEISDFKASVFLDFVIKEIGPYLYNQALQDAHQLMLNKVEELYDLEKRPR